MAILYTDKNIQIVTPDTSGSIPIYTEVGYSNAPTHFVDICSEGLKSYNERRRTEKLPKRLHTYARVNSNHNDYIFFRAPYVKQKDNSWKTLGFEDMFTRMYAKSRMELAQSIAKYSENISHLVTINVNPENTYVFRSSMRIVRKGNTEQEIERKRQILIASRIKLSEYLSDAKYEREIVALIPYISHEWFSSCITTKNLSSSDNSDNSDNSENFDNSDNSENSENSLENLPHKKPRSMRSRINESQTPKNVSVSHTRKRMASQISVENSPNKQRSMRPRINKSHKKQRTSRRKL